MQNSVADAIRTIRETRGMSQSELARRAGLAKATVNDLESNSERSPGLDTLKRVADALDVHVATILGISTEGISLAVEEIPAEKAAEVAARHRLAIDQDATAHCRYFLAGAGSSLHGNRIHPGDLLIACGDGEPDKPGAVIIQNRARLAGFEVRLYLDPYLIGPDCDGLLRHDMKQSPDLTIIGRIVTRIGTIA